MDKNRLWLIGAVLVAGCLVAGGWFLGIQPQLDAAQTALQQRASVEETNQTDEAVLAGLRADYSRLPQLEDQLSTLEASVPADSAAPALVKELDALSSSAGVTITDFTMSDAQAYTPVATASTSAGSSSSTGSASSGTSATGTSAASSGTTSTTDATTPSAAASTTAGAPPVSNPLITASNFVAQPVTVTVSGSYAAVLRYLQGLQTGARLFLVDSIAISSSANSTAGTVQAQIGGLVYSLVSYDSPAVSGSSATTDASGG